MERNQELKTLYAIITFLWNTMKEYDYRNMKESDWDKLAEEMDEKFTDLKKIDAPSAYLYGHMMYSLIDYMTPGKRAEWKRR